MEIPAHILQDLRSDALALADESEQDVLGPDVVLPELDGLAEGQLQDFLRARGERDVPRGSSFALPDDLLELPPDRTERDPERLQSLGSDASPFVNQSEQDVFRPDVVVVQCPRF